MAQGSSVNAALNSMDLAFTIAVIVGIAALIYKSFYQDPKKIKELADKIDQRNEENA